MDPELRSWIDRRERAIAALRAILIDNLHVQAAADDIDPDAPLFGTGLGLDSVDTVELVVATEATFGVSLPEQELRRELRTINTLVDLLLRLQTQQGAR